MQIMHVLNKASMHEHITSIKAHKYASMQMMQVQHYTDYANTQIWRLCMYSGMNY
jgi:hypothetical protein